MIKTWNRGTSAQSQEDEISALAPGVNTNPITQLIIDTLEIYSYEEDNLSPQQQASYNSYFNSNGWTDITP